MTSDTYSSLPVFHFAEIIDKRRSKRKYRGVIFGNFGAMNQGDEAILAGQLRELATLPSVTVSVIGRFPKEIERQHHVRSVALYRFGNVFREIARSDFVIVGGGGLICKTDRPFIGFFYQLSILFLFFFLPRVYKKKLYALGIGIYGNTNPLILWMALLLLRYAAVITVRDHHSYRLLVEKNIQAQLYKDNSYLMETVTPAVVLSDPYFKRMYNKRKKHIGISLIRPERKSDEKRLLSELVKFIGKNYKNTDYWFYSADYHPGYFNDENFGHVLHMTLQKKIGRDIRFYFIPTEWDANRFFSSFGLMDFIISMRLHAAIFAHRLKIPFYAISYDKKCTSFLQAIGKSQPQIEDVNWQSIHEQYRQALKKQH